MQLGMRLDAYLAQNNSDHRLTFRQERRLRHKANRRTRQAQLLDQAKGCRTCGVQVGKCQTASGRPAKNPHKGRELGDA
jgi:hypothetical protein